MAKTGFTVSGGVERWWNVDRALLPTKLFYFFFLAAIGTLLPFITIYMKQLGLSSAETGIIYGIMPFVGFFIRPAIGAVADKLHQHRLVLMICCFLSGIFYVCLLFVPANHKVQTTKIFTSIHCNTQDSYISDCNNGLSCPYSLTEYAYHTTIGNDTTQNLRCSVSCTFAVPGAYQTRVCFTSSIHAFTESCVDVWVSSSQDSSVNFELADAGTIMQNEVIKDRTKLKLKNPKCRDYRDYDLKNLTFNEKPFWRIVCDSETILNCHINCEKLPDDNCYTVVSSYQRTFWIFFIVFLLANIALAPSLSLNDAIAYDILGEHGSKWGKQRLWGTVGFAAFAIASTLIMDAISNKQNQQQSLNYDVSFYIFGGHMLICVLVAGFLKVSPDFVCSQMFRNVSKLLTYPEVTVFLLTVLIFGVYTGVIEAFLFWYLYDLQRTYTGHVDGNAIILGLCLLFNCIAEAPLLFVSGSIIKRVGQVSCIYLAFLGYAIRFIGYSFVSNAWYVLLLEPLHGLTYGLLWAAATSYTNKISPPGMSATVQGLVSGLHFGFGKGIGSLLTGFLFERLGPVWSFRLYGISSLVFLLIYFILQMVWFRRGPGQARDNLTVKVPHLDIKPQDQEEDDGNPSADECLLGNHTDTQTDMDIPVQVSDNHHDNMLEGTAEKGTDLNKQTDATDSELPVL